MTAALPASPDALDADVAHAAGRLRLAATRLARLLRQQTDSDLSPTLAAALYTIGRQGPLTLGALAESEQVAPPTITKVVDKLTAAGLVHRRTDEADRRVVRVELTDLGRTTLAERSARKDAWLAVRLGDLPATDVATILAALPLLERLAGLPGPHGEAR